MQKFLQKYKCERPGGGSLSVNKWRPSAASSNNLVENQQRFKRVFINVLITFISIS